MFVEHFFNWLKNIEEIKLSDGWYEITTPIPDRHNDGIVVYVKEENGQIIISDDGYFFDDMYFFEVIVTDRMNKFFEKLNIEITPNKELRVLTTIKMFPVALNNFVQAISVASKTF
nr:MAG TPA: protein of unknown function DUF1828 [Caudoviricetes sp.]